jgi:hypothetical protein
MATHAVAQEAPERGQLYSVDMFKVEPSHAAEFEAAIGLFLEAAHQAGVSSDFYWYIWVDHFTYAVAFPVPDMASFDDPMAMMRQYQGTPGEATLAEAEARFSKLDYQVVSREVIERVADWSYAPENAEQAGYAEVIDVWFKPNKAEEFDAVIKDIMSFFAELGYSYECRGYRVHFGDAGRASFHFRYASPGPYFGEKSLESLIEPSGGSEEWAGLIERFMDVVIDEKSVRWMFRPELSYTGSN